MQVTLAGALAARGFPVSCVLPQAKGPYLEHLPRERRARRSWDPQPLSLVHRLARFLRRRRPSLLFAAQHHTIVAAVLARRLAGSRMPLVAVQHNTLSEVCRNSRYRLTRWFIPTALRMLLPQAEMIGAVSEGVARDLASTLGPAPLAGDGALQSRRGEGLAERAAEPSGHPWLDRKEVPVVLGVGSLIERKDFPTLIHAFAHLARRRPARLVVLGEGPERPRLERLIGELGLADLVALPGFVANPLAYMAKADVLALSSRVEGMPTVIIEALACGTPIVATDCPHGPAELLGDGAYGRLVPVGDAEALGEALAATLSEPRDPERQRRRAAEFAVDRAVERYVQADPGLWRGERRRVDREGLRHDVRLVEPLERKPPARRPHRPHELGPRQQLDHGGSQLLGRIGPAQEARYARDDRVPTAWRIGGDDRNPGGSRLDEAARHALAVARWQHHRRRPPHRGFHDLWRRPAAPRHDALGVQGFQPGAVDEVGVFRAVVVLGTTEQDELRASGWLLLHQPRRRDEVADALAPKHARGHDEGVSHRSAMPPAPARVASCRCRTRRSGKPGRRSPAAAPRIPQGRCRSGRWHGCGRRSARRRRPRTSGVSQGRRLACTIPLPVSAATMPRVPASLAAGTP